MERWQNKVAVVTGASAGIGAVTATDLLKKGLIVVALARRDTRLQEIKRTLPANQQSRYHPLKCDVSKEEDVTRAFSWIEKNLGGTDVLVNNAGVVRMGPCLAEAGNTADVRATVDINIMGVVYCVREAFISMKKRNVDGHIIIINSVAGHNASAVPSDGFNIYPASKFAVTAMVETYRQEFRNAGTKVKVTSLSPGVTQTDIIPDMDKFAEKGVTCLQPEDISNAILFVLSTPPHVQIHELTIKSIGEQF